MGSFIRRASRKPSNTAKYLQPSRHRSSLIRSLSSSILRSSAPNSLLSSCRASSAACFSFLMVFTIPARTSRASGDLSIPKMVSFSVVWRLSIRCCRICQALPDSPLRRRFSNCDEMRAFSFIRLAAARPVWPFTPPLHRDCQHYVCRANRHTPIPMWPKMEHSVGRKGAVNSKAYGQSPPPPRAR